MRDLLQLPLPAAAVACGALLLLGGLRAQSRVAGMGLALATSLMLVAIEQLEGPGSGSGILIGLALGFVIGFALYHFQLIMVTLSHIALVAVAVGLLELILHLSSQPEWFTFGPRVAGFAKVLAFGCLLIGGFTIVGVAFGRRLGRKWPVVVGFLAACGVFLHAWVFLPLAAAFGLGILDTQRPPSGGRPGATLGMLSLTIVMSLAYYLWFLELAMSNWYALGGSPSVAAVFSMPAFWYVGTIAKRTLPAPVTSSS